MKYLFDQREGKSCKILPVKEGLVCEGQLI